MEAFNHYIPSSSQDTLQHKRRYDVFLSFRGPDLRKSLVDHLFQSLSSAGFHVFLDTERLEKGENIGISLEEAIRDSTVHIPIFSSEYASSAWCLHELSLIWICKSTCPQTKTIPLFYDVEPSVVRYQTGKYGESLEKLCGKGRHSTAEMDKWKEALYNVSLLSGWSLSLTAAGYEGRLVKQVVMDLLQTLKINWVHVAKHPVGLSDPMEEVTKLLEIGSDIRQRTVGIWGMGGMGKTTLSKAVYNNVHHLFQASCFVSDIRAIAKESVKGLVNLQRQILSKLVKVNTEIDSVDDGIMQMKTHLASKKVLVILDDVDHQKQLDALFGDCYGPGSRIIITTRDEKVLQLGKVDKIHPMKGLSQDEGVQLFSWHAFLRACPTNGYEDMTLQIVIACQGLPLSLEVLGAHLYDERSMRIWSEALQKIHKEVYQSLKISYDALSPEEQQMFLDIACFFIMPQFSSSRDYTLNFYLGFWEELKCTPAYTNLRSLQGKSLIRIEEYRSYCRFWMHDHLRDLGRKIVEDESPDDPSKRSRLWCEKDILSALEHTEEMPKVKGLMLTGFEPRQIHQMDNLALMHNLKFLFCCGLDRLREIPMLPRDLRYLILSDCGCEMDDEWDFNSLGQLQFLRYLRINNTPFAYYPSEVGHLRFLKEMHIMQCPLKELPTLPQSLIHIEVIECLELQNISSMSPMIKLEILDVYGCPSLDQLPELYWMQSLTELRLDSCRRLEELPPLPEGLLKLTLDDLANLEELPPLPKGLLKLSLYNGANLKELPPLPKGLVELRLNNCANLKELPPLPEGLVKLMLYELANLKELPPLPKGLVELRLNNCANLKELPPLPKGLVELRLNNCANLKELPPLPKGLVELRLNNLANLKELPPLPEGLVKLMLDDLANLKELPPLPKGLVELGLYHFANLKELPSLPEGLLKLIVDSTTLEELPPLPKGLVELYLSSRNIKELPPLPKGLLELILICCENLKELPPLPESLIDPCIVACNQLRINASQPSTRDKGKHMISDSNNETDPSAMRNFPKRSRTMEPSPCFSVQDSFMEQGESSAPPPADPDYEIPNNLDTALSLALTVPERPPMTEASPRFLHGIAKEGNVESMGATREEMIQDVQSIFIEEDESSVPPAEDLH